MKEEKQTNKQTNKRLKNKNKQKIVYQNVDDWARQSRPDLMVHDLQIFSFSESPLGKKNNNKPKPEKIFSW